jgi:hypothetical protein
MSSKMPDEIDAKIRIILDPNSPTVSSRKDILYSEMMRADAKTGSQEESEEAGKSQKGIRVVVEHVSDKKEPENQHKFCIRHCFESRLQKCRFCIYLESKKKSNFD